jgi:alpha-glucosidase
MRAGETDGKVAQPVSLGFLAPGRYKATIWEDGDAIDAVQRREIEVTAKDKLELQLARAGGAVVVLERRQ